MGKRNSTNTRANYISLQCEPFLYLAIADYGRPLVVHGVQAVWYYRIPERDILILALAITAVVANGTKMKYSLGDSRFKLLCKILDLHSAETPLGC